MTLFGDPDDLFGGTPMTFFGDTNDILGATRPFSWGHTNDFLFGVTHDLFGGEMTFVGRQAHSPREARGKKWY